jgi:hypothetical protein
MEYLKLTHSEEMEQLKTKHVQEMTRLQEKLLEVSIYNEKLEDKVIKLQEDNKLLENIIEENQQGAFILGVNREESITANEYLRNVQKK